MVFATDRDQVFDIGPATVAVPLSDMVKLASVHRSVALEASAVPYGHRKPLSSIREALLAAQPEGTAGPVEDHPCQLRVRRQRLEDPAGYGSGADHLDVTVAVCTVHHAERSDEDHLGGRLSLHTGQFVYG